MHKRVTSSMIAGELDESDLPENETYSSLDRSIKESFIDEDVDGKTSYEHLKGLKDHYFHKKMWSISILIIISFLVGFQAIIVVLIGSNLLDFRAYQWLMPIMFGQNLAQIVGLAVFVVKSLFKDFAPYARQAKEKEL